MPKRCLKRRNSGSGSASPADTACRTLDRSNSRGRRLMREQHGEVGRHAEEQRRPVALDDLVDARRHRRLGQQDRGGAHRERHVKRVAEPVGEEQFRRAEAAIALAHAEHAPARTTRRTRPCRAAGGRSPSAIRCSPTNRARTPWRPCASARRRRCSTRWRGRVSKSRQPSRRSPHTITCSRRGSSARSIASNSPSSARLITSTRAPLSLSAY